MYVRNKVKKNIVGIMLLVIDQSLVIEDPKSYQLFLINLVLSIVKVFFPTYLWRGGTQSVDISTPLDDTTLKLSEQSQSTSKW